LSAGNDLAAAPKSQLDIGFHQLYNLDFDGAQQQFAAYEQERPKDPLGPAAEAAGLVFAELNRLGILESRFFADDDAFRSRPKPKPDPDAYTRFVATIERAQSLAQHQLATQPKDANSLLALALAAGLQADYASLIQNRNLAALHFTREATQQAQLLLAVCPDCYDAYVATGISKYLIGDLPAPFRWVLRLGGFSGDKTDGVRQLQLAAEHGRYLAPFARILLAVAYLRDQHREAARQLLAQLHNDFPDNPLFPHELRRLEQHQGD
jgi:hypothetical protein